MSRKLARVVRVSEIRPIEGADAIEVAFVGGWPVVVKKNEFRANDLAVYFEIDSFLPQGNPAWQFLVDKSSKVFEEAQGHVLRAVKLRGQLSQGLLLPFTETLAPYARDYDGEGQPTWVAPEDFFQEGEDVSEVLGVRKYEAPVPAELAGLARGMFPSLVPKTDQERIQNLSLELQLWQQAGAAGELSWEVTEKLEGSSCTFAWLDGELHVCSRNIDLFETEGNSLWRVAREVGVEEKLRSTFGNRNIALQGELIGFGVEGNIYGLRNQKFCLYDVFDVQQAGYWKAQERQSLAKELGIEHVPVIQERLFLTPELNMEALLLMADGESRLRKGQLREGLVFKALEKPVSFKAVSNKYLLKQK